MKTPIVAEIPSKRIQRERRESKVKLALRSPGYVSYRRHTATGDVRVATALTRWAGG